MLAFIPEHHGLPLVLALRDEAKVMAGAAAIVFSPLMMALALAQPNSLSASIFRPSGIPHSTGSYGTTIAR
jgi:hypothetical protein